MDEKKALALLKKYAPDERVHRIMLSHSKAVQKLAMEWARKIKKNGYRVDLEFVSTAALLHDIGRYKYPPGAKEAIRHGIEGGKMLRKEGYPKHAKLIENHIGAGITKSDIKGQGLPLPMKDYIPKTIEEKIVSCADCLISGGKRVPISEEVRRFMSELGESYGKRVLKLYKEIEELLKERKI